MPILSRKPHTVLTGTEAHIKNVAESLIPVQNKIQASQLATNSKFIAALQTYFEDTAEPR